MPSVWGSALLGAYYRPLRSRVLWAALWRYFSGQGIDTAS